MIEERDIIKLDDGKTYAVMSSVMNNNKKYYYLMDVNNRSNVKFCYEEDNALIEENRTDVLKKLVSLFASNLRKEIKILEE